MSQTLNASQRRVCRTLAVSRSSLRPLPSGHKQDNRWQKQVPGNMGGRVQQPQPYVQHARWYVNELIPTRADPETGNPITNVYFIQLGNNPDYGTAKGTFGIVPKRRVNNMFVRRQHEGNFDADTNTYATNKSVFWSFPTGVAVASNRSLAVLQDMQVKPI